MDPMQKKNEEIRQQNNIKTNWDYRNYLVQNAKTIMAHNKYNSCLSSGITSDITMNTSNKPPHLFKSTLDTERPFGYQTSDLKETFIYKRHTEMLKVAPKI